MARVDPNVLGRALTAGASQRVAVDVLRQEPSAHVHTSTSAAGAGANVTY